MLTVFRTIISSVIWFSIVIAIALYGVPKYYSTGVLAVGFILWFFSSAIILFITDEDRFSEVSYIGFAFAGFALMAWGFWYMVAFEAVLYSAFKSGMFNSAYRTITRKNPA